MALVYGNKSERKFLIYWKKNSVQLKKLLTTIYNAIKAGHFSHMNKFV